MGFRRTGSLIAEFPPTSLFDTATSCNLSLTKSLTEGPCYFQVDNRVDISEQEKGLPMQLCLQVVNEDCQPLDGLEVEVWHCNTEGAYSGDTSASDDRRRFTSGFCTGNNVTAQQAKWFRGGQITDKDGRVNFQTCFPGWYSGRAIHIHFRVRNKNRDEIVSQFCFEDAFAEMVCTQLPDYKNRGAQNTPLSGGRDSVYRSNYQDFLFDLIKNSDGSLLAYKTIVIAHTLNAE
ncbi:intradiol ring-cleavage dioxygenase [Nitrincola alkalisediminis]|uniref:dioxygenase family protein n=1 Tax=Nitrincola alkalisediminis TaxID=1366656 RepID=UPI0031B567E4